MLNVDEIEPWQQQFTTYIPGPLKNAAPNSHTSSSAKKSEKLDILHGHLVELFRGQFHQFFCQTKSCRRTGFGEKIIVQFHQ